MVFTRKDGVYHGRTVSLPKGNITRFFNETPNPKKQQQKQPQPIYPFTCEVDAERIMQVEMTKFHALDDGSSGWEGPGMGLGRIMGILAGPPPEK